jgi:spermidine synthase
MTQRPASFHFELARRLASRRASFVPSLTVFLAGANLILVQWVLVRELTALLRGTELVTLLVSISYFVGISVGYKVSGRVPRQWLPVFGVLILVSHLTLPIWFRLLVIALEANGAAWASFFVLPLVTPFVVSAFYSVFLPHFVEHGEGQLPQLYALELIGSMLGVLTLISFSGLGLSAIYLIYGVALLVILMLLGLRLHWVMLLALLSVGWLLVLPTMNSWSNSLWYIRLHDLPPGTQTLFTGYSPYQKVDVLESPDGIRYLYLDGLQHFGTEDGSRLNVVMGHVPASLIQPRNALVIGAGSMEMARMIANFAGHVKTVEIDPLVIEASLRYFDDFNLMSVLANRSIVIDDAKHFITNTAEKYDLISTDLPAAYSLQTASLYSAPFYKAVSERLLPEGILVANLTSTFAPDDIVSRRIAASLLANFGEVMVITSASAGWSFAYAGQTLPFDRTTLADSLRANGELQFVIYETPIVRDIVGDAQPITLESMDIVLRISAEWISERLTPDEE